jgi:hypothetical protein
MGRRPTDTYCEGLPLSRVTRPSMRRPRHDQGDKFLTEERRIMPLDEDRHQLCYGTYHATIDPALETFYGRNSPGKLHFFLAKGCAFLGSLRRDHKNAHGMSERTRGKAHLHVTLQVQEAANWRRAGRRASHLLKVLRRACGTTERQQGRQTPCNTRRQTPRSQPYTQK